MNLLILWLTTALSVALGAYLVPGVQVASFGVALVVAIVMGLVNLVVKPLLLLITLPINILTLGLFTFVINALLLMLVSRLVDGFTITGFLPALLLSLVLAVIAAIIGSM